MGGESQTAPRRLLAFLAFCFVLLLALPGSALSYEFGPTVKQIGPEQTVFDWSASACADGNYPDLPTRVFKDSSNQLQLILSHDTSYRMVGPTFDSLQVNCTPIMSSTNNPDPSTYDNTEWISSTYTKDGITVWALIHNEYEGWLYPGECTTQGTFDPKCWYNSATFATSTDQGATYTHTTPPTHLVASVPYQYVPDTGPYGYFAPSNMFYRASDRYIYALLYTEAYQAQQVGTCIMRTRTPTDPKSWRAWDGTGYNIQFINPYNPSVVPSPPTDHVCAPISFNQVQQMHASVTYNSYLGKYLLVDTSWKVDPISGETVWGVYYSTSADLVTWSDRVLLMKAELPWTYQCGDENPILYPTIIDQTSTTRNYETSKRTDYLYFTRLNYSNCLLTSDRDLIRIPFGFRSPTGGDPPPIGN